MTCETSVDSSNNIYNSTCDLSTSEIPFLLFSIFFVLVLSILINHVHHFFRIGGND